MVAADVFVDGLLGVGRKLGVAPFVLTVGLSGFETENLAAGIATNAKGLPGAAAGTFLGGVTFLAIAAAARSGRAFLAGEGADQHERHALTRLLGGLAVLTGGGWLLGEGLRTVVRNAGVSPTLLGNTALAATVEAEELARVACPRAVGARSSHSGTSPAQLSTSRRSTPA